MTNAKSAFMPMPGATSTGLRAYRPIAQLPRKLTMTVAVSAAGNGTPAADKMPGLTTMMYIAVRNVVMPATISVFVREPAARMPKNRSSAVLSCCVVAVVSIVLAYCFQC